MFARLSPSRLVGLVGLAAVTPALLHRAPLFAAAAATAVLAAALGGRLRTRTSH